MIEPNEAQRFKESTAERHGRMAGVMSPTFRCRACGAFKSTIGRQQCVPGDRKSGFYCAACAKQREAGK